MFTALRLHLGLPAPVNHLIVVCLFQFVTLFIFSMPRITIYKKMLWKNFLFLHCYIFIATTFDTHSYFLPRTFFFQAVLFYESTERHSSVLFTFSPFHLLFSQRHQLAFVARKIDVPQKGKQKAQTACTSITLFPCAIFWEERRATVFCNSIRNFFL